MIIFQEIYGLYGLEHHIVETNGEGGGRTGEYNATQSVDIVRLSFTKKLNKETY